VGYFVGGCVSEVFDEWEIEHSCVWKGVLDDRLMKDSE
jgi:hypothetical protein